MQSLEALARECLLSKQSVAEALQRLEVAATEELSRLQQTARGLAELETSAEFPPSPQTREKAAARSDWLDAED